MFNPATYKGMKVNDPKILMMGGQGLLVTMWIIYITCISIIIHHNTNNISILTNIFAGFGLFFTLISPIYFDDEVKPLAQWALVVLSFCLLLSTSYYDPAKLKDDAERENAKTCQNAAIALFVITLLFYGVMGGVYYTGDKQLKEVMTKLFLDKN